MHEITGLFEEIRQKENLLSRMFVYSLNIKFGKYSKIYKRKEILFLIYITSKKKCCLSFNFLLLPHKFPDFP